MWPRYDYDHVAFTILDIDCTSSAYGIETKLRGIREEYFSLSYGWEVWVMIHHNIKAKQKNMGLIGVEMS